MGSITIQIIGDGSVGTKTKTYTVSDADVNRVVTAAKTISGAVTTVQACLDLASLLQSTVTNLVLSSEQRTASVAVLPITST